MFVCNFLVEKLPQYVDYVCDSLCTKGGPGLQVPVRITGSISPSHIDSVRIKCKMLIRFWKRVVRFKARTKSRSGYGPDKTGHV